MNYFRQFIIPFSGLKLGEHHFDFEIDSTFFDHFEYSEIKQGAVNVHLSMEREEKMLVMHFTLEGTITVPCDRCNEPVDLEINGDEDLIIKFGSDFIEESETVQIIPEGETQIDLSPFLYEYIHLAMPVRRVHPDDENGNSLCDPEILKRLEELPAPSGPDPRWEALNKLKTKN